MTEYTNIIERAIDFANRRHAGAHRKGTTIPYILHPLEAAAICAYLTKDPEVIAAAVLHDVVEDTGTPVREIRIHFGERVAMLVANESENKREDQAAEDTWEIRKKETIVHLTACTDLDVKRVAFSDKLANLRAIHCDHCALGDKLWERFNQNDPAKIGWYYNSFLTCCSELEKTPAYQEYKCLIEDVFHGNIAAL